MKISSLQKLRYQYTPKLPAMLRGGISNISVKEGAETQSVADQEKSKLFSHIPTVKRDYIPKRRKYFCC